MQNSYCLKTKTFPLAKLVAILALLFFVLPAFSPAQVGNSSLSGTVVDATGAVVPNAQVELKDEVTNSVVRTVTTNTSGFFNFVSILPRSYTVKISAPGFTALEQRNIELASYESRSLPNLVMKISATKEAVEVVGVTPTVPLDTGEVRSTLDQNLLTNLMTVGRNAAELVKIMPGMGIIGGSMLGQDAYDSINTTSNSGIVGRYSANGTQPYGGMQVTLDGGVIIDTGNMGTQVANINSDQIAELTVRSSSFNAEYENGPVTISATSKGGGSEFHGNAYIYTRAGTFNAEDAFFKAQHLKKPNDHYWYPGFTIGGPIKKDKLFFFAGYEYMMQHPQGSLYNLVVPTDAMRAGDFSASSLPAQWAQNGWEIGQVPCASNISGQWYYNNFCGATGAGSGADITNGNVANHIDANGLAYMKTMPAPNVNPSTTGGYNYQFLDQSPLNRWELKGRVDYNLSQNTRFYFSYNRQHEKDINTRGVWWEPNGTLPYPSTFPATVITDLYSGSVTHVFSPTITNEATFNWTRFINPLKFAKQSAVDPSKVGLNIQLPFDAKTAAMIPNTLSWSGHVPMYLAPAFSGAWQGGAFGALKRVPSFSDNFAWVKGSHTMKFGFFWSRWGNQQTEGTWDSNNGFPQGRYEFENYAWGTTGNPIADMLIGHAANFAQTSADPVHTLWFTNMAFYAQDQWKVTRRLTLNYGIRFDHPGQWFPASGPGLPVWDPSNCTSTGVGPKCVGAALPGLSWHARNSSIPMSGYKSATFVADPRVGAAYDLFGTGKTVLRGGFGVYRYQFAYNSIPQDSPLGIQAFQTTCNILSWAQIGTDPACAPTTPAGSLPASSGGLSQVALQKGDDRTPYTQNWNFMVDQVLPYKMTFEMGYTGSRSRNMLLGGNNGNNVNWVPLGAYWEPDPVTGTQYCNAPFVTTGCTGTGIPNSAVVDYRPYNYSNIQVNTHGSYSNYHALLTSLQKQTGRVNLMLNYTWSKTLGLRDGQTDNGSGASGVLVDAFHLRNNYGVLGYDRTHIFNVSYIVNLPKPIKGGSFGNSILAQVVNGWIISGVTQAQSGPPIQTATNGNLNATYPGSLSNTALMGSNVNTPLVPVLTCDPRHGLSSGQYFNPNCFAPPTTQGQNGTLVWPYIKGPAYLNNDLGLFKDFKITERQTLQFRVQAFNFINHPLSDLTLDNRDITLSFVCPSTGCTNPSSTFSGLNMTNVNSALTGRALYERGRRVMEFALKYTF